MGLGAKDLLTLAPGWLVREAWVGWVFVTRWSVVTAFASIAFVRFPFTTMVALRVKVHFPRAGRLPPLYMKDPSPGFPVIVPPQVPTLKFVGLARVMPLGIVSVK